MAYKQNIPLGKFIYIYIYIFGIIDYFKFKKFCFYNHYPSV